MDLNFLPGGQAGVIWINACLAAYNTWDEMGQKKSFIFKYSIKFMTAL